MMIMLLHPRRIIIIIKARCAFTPSYVAARFRVIDVSTPHGIEAARKYIAKRLPVIMRGSSDDGGASWPLLGPTLKKELSSASAIGGHLMGKQVTVLHAPQQASQRFTYYFSENAEKRMGITMTWRQPLLLLLLRSIGI